VKQKERKKKKLFLKINLPLLGQPNIKINLSFLGQPNIKINLPFLGQPNIYFDEFSLAVRKLFKSK